MSTVIGPLNYSDPRAAQVREPEDLEHFRSAVHGDVAVYASTINQTQALIDRWGEIMFVASQKAEQILAEVVETVPNPPPA